MKITEVPRGIKPEEFDEMLELVKLVFNADLGERVPLLYNDENLENLRILKEDGKIVTHIGISIKEVSISGCKTKVGNIGSVCTHPDYRQRGLATLVLEDVIRKLKADGATVMSVSGGRGLYQRAGCRSAGKRLIFNISRADIEKFSLPYPIEVVPYEKEKHLKEMASLYQREAIRFWRPLEDFEAIMKIANAGLMIKVIIIDGNCVGYIVVNFSQKKDSEEKICDVGEFAEFAGSRIAIMSVVKLLFESHNLVEFSLGTFPQDIELLLILKEIGLKPTISSFGNTWRIINLPLLMEHFRPYIEQQLSTKVAEQLNVGKEDEKHFFQFGDEKFFIEDEGTLVKMIFGTPDNAEEKIMPKEGQLVEVLTEIFPLPFVCPGLNNV